MILLHKQVKIAKIILFYWFKQDEYTIITLIIVEWYARYSDSSYELWIETNSLA